MQSSTAFSAGSRTAAPARKNAAIAQGTPRAANGGRPASAERSSTPASGGSHFAGKGRGYSGGRSQAARPAGGQRGGGARTKQYIDPARFIQGARIVEREEYIPQNKFEDFAVHPRILTNLLAKGYKTPTPIQDQTIQLVLEGRDVVGIANTGTGKTAAFSVPLIHDLMLNMQNRLLIMAPTRELAQQIVEEMVSFSKNCSLRIALLIGGASMHLQKRDLAGNPRIVVGTPGRIKDHIGQGTLILTHFNRVVLDEVDRMLDMGFIKDITAILSRVNPVRQSLFFSATMEPEIQKLIERFARNPVTVSTRVGQTAECVNQDVVFYRGNDEKIDKLHEILIRPTTGKTIIFDDTKRSVEKLAKELQDRGFKVDRIHGNKSQAQRTRALSRLKSDEISILVATDVAARGIDVSDITHVINYSQPNTYDDYIHRIGRTGRAGKAGEALTFLVK